MEDNDFRLLERAAGGDAQAFDQLVARHAPGLFRLAYSLLGNREDAEDVLQEAFLGAFRGFRKFGKRSAVRTWLGQILVRQVAVWRRGHLPRRTISLETGGGWKWVG